ncbi:hypothetical protein [Mechercharimyces sp. CAU 1602]|uniref:hypothetical protein n=1 Tax=Mechercharimyces sp. CAU 1602 TaxID=2973933 RepID=UPI002163C5E8|nr:hypothetical protein [Mechercharimyces sp. CAU 1602]MCS1351907.1 hypothetical protein [Mechercharimyces sp. CAU 1602]
MNKGNTIPITRKVQAVRKALAEKDIAKVAREFQIAPDVLSVWIRQYMQGAFTDGKPIHTPKKNTGKENKISAGAPIQTKTNAAFAAENRVLKQIIGEKELLIARLKRQIP